MPLTDKEQAEYAEWGTELPESTPHGNGKPESLHATNWRMEGPGMLVADTDVGRLVQNIGTNYICLGTDDHNKPILKKLDL